MDQTLSVETVTVSSTRPSVTREKTNER